jgi:hypothetical protein
MHTAFSLFEKLLNNTIVASQFETVTGFFP